MVRERTRLSQQVSERDTLGLGPVGLLNERPSPDLFLIIFAPVHRDQASMDNLHRTFASWLFPAVGADMWTVIGGSNIVCGGGCL